MKVITEAILREELYHKQPKNYYLEKGKLLSPAAREYLQQRKIVVIEKEDVRPEDEAGEKELQEVRTSTPAAKYVDYRTGAFFEKKPEYMTQLHGNVLVEKSHPRIAFRSEMDHLQAEVILAQTMTARQCSQELQDGLGEILAVLRSIIRCEVLEEKLPPMKLLGLDSAQLRDHSHHPEKYYGIRQMTLPDQSMGPVYAWLNLLRTDVRRTEVAAIRAFELERDFEHKDILEALNRLSSAMHILMCKFLAGESYDRVRD